MNGYNHNCLRRQHFYYFCFSDATAVSRAGFGVGSGPINLDDVQCTGSEAALINCPFDRFTFDCSHVEDAGVRCSITRMFI